MLKDYLRTIKKRYEGVTSESEIEFCTAKWPRVRQNARYVMLLAMTCQLKLDTTWFIYRRVRFLVQYVSDITVKGL